MPQNSPQTSGFTLLEILIALFIFTIVAVIMSSVLHTVFTAAAGTEKRSVRLAELEMTTLLLSHDLEQTVDRPVINAKNINENTFDGTANKITFTHGGLANPTANVLRSTLQRTRYSLEKNKLIRQIWPVLDQTKTTKPMQRKILDDVTELQFEFLDEKGFFSNTWPPAGQSKSAALPRAVRVTITLKDWGKLSQLYLITSAAGIETHA